MSLPHNRSTGVRKVVGGTALALGVCLLTASCGGSSESAGHAEHGGDAPVHNGQEHAGHSPSPAGDHANMPGMNMGDASAPAADAIPGANLRTGPFTLLDSRPPDMDTVAGNAWLATHEHGTTATVRMTGLFPGEKYMAHVHADPCAQNEGGEHFRFDPQGSDMPPNEIHLAFTADQSGAGLMTANNDKPADQARSVVVHPADAVDNRIACADF